MENLHTDVRAKRVKVVSFLDSRMKISWQNWHFGENNIHSTNGKCVQGGQGMDFHTGQEWLQDKRLDTVT